MPRNVYTPEEDELIKAARQDELTDLAVRLGRKRYNIVNRRTRLLRGELGYTSFRKPSPAERAKALTANVTAGRPTWFEDDDLALKLRSGR